MYLYAAHYRLRSTLRQLSCAETVAPKRRRRTVLLRTSATTASSRGLSRTCSSNSESPPENYSLTDYN